LIVVKRWRVSGRRRRAERVAVVGRGAEAATTPEFVFRGRWRLDAQNLAADGFGRLVER
jgi:hypothetical protein